MYCMSVNMLDLCLVAIFSLRIVKFCFAAQTIYSMQGVQWLALYNEVMLSAVFSIQLIVV